MRRLIFFILLVGLLAAGCASPEAATETGTTVTVYRPPT